MPLTNFTDAGKQAIADVLQHLNAAQEAFNTLNAVENHACFDFHAEGHSLNHAVRWGAQAAEEVHAALFIK